MVLTKLEVLDLFVQHCDNDTIAARIKQMYQLLGPAQQAGAYDVIKADILAVYNDVKDRLTSQDVSLETLITDTDTTISDITNAE